MTTKMKGLFKGLRYISQIFDEENKEHDIQIGFPTDVKHVAHIGWDGPSAAAAADSNPSWMKEFKATNGQSAPLDSNGNNQDDSETKWVSEDSKKGNRAIPDSPGRDIPELARSTRRHTSSDSNNNDQSPKKKKDSSTKTRHSRRNNSKDASELNPSDLSSQDLAKKTRRKKSKDTDGGGSTRSKSKDTDGSGSTRSRSKPAPGHDAGSVLRTMDPVS